MTNLVEHCAQMAASFRQRFPGVEVDIWTERAPLPPGWAGVVTPRDTLFVRLTVGKRVETVVFDEMYAGCPKAAAERLFESVARAAVGLTAN